MADFIGKHVVGSVFQSQDDWFVADSNYYANAAELEEGFDIFTEHGWHTVAHKVSSDNALVVAHLKAEQEKKDAYLKANASKFEQQLAREKAKEDAKQEAQRAKMLKDFPIGQRVQNRYIANRVGRVVAYHETQARLSIQWDSEDHPAYISTTTKTQWYGLFDQKAV